MKYADSTHNCNLRNGNYNPALAGRKYATLMSERNHFTKMDDAMKQVINKYLALDWCPEQIRGRLKLATFQ